MEQTQNPIVQFEGVSIERDGLFLLYDINLKIPQKSIFALFGLNGAGKSSLAYSLMGLPSHAPTSGRILFENEDITNMPIWERARRGITLAWQEPARFEGLSVRTYLQISAGKRECSLEKCLSDVGLEPSRYIGRNVDNTLSGGERKRIELASIIAMAPRLAILDEPDSGVDVASISAIKYALKTMNYYGSTVILITHEKEIAELAQDGALICGGMVECQDKVPKIFEHFAQKCGACSRGEYGRK